MIKLTYLDAQRILLKSGVSPFVALSILKKMEETTELNQKRYHENIISYHNISPQTQTALKRAGITKVDELKNYVDNFGIYKLLDIEGIGDMRLIEIRKVFHL